MPLRYRALGVVLLAAACRSYTPQPLVPEDVLEQMIAARFVAAPGEPLTLAEAAARLRAHNPRVREARAAYATTRAFADVPTPRPNPSLSLTPTFLDAGDVLGSDRWGLDASLGWQVFLSGTRRLQDDLNAIRAEEALVHAAGVEREEYLALRKAYLRLAAAAHVAQARRDLVVTAEQSRAIVRRLVTAGQATALDVAEADLDVYEAEAHLLAAEEAVAEARGDLAARVGALPEAFAVRDVPPLPDAVPPATVLHERVLRDHPALARLRATYLGAEKELQLAVAGQYPNLDLGALYERDSGTNKYGLGIGLALPIFDRNQPEIARADARRDEIRARFETQVGRSIAAIDRARRRLEARRRRLAHVNEKVRPAAARTVALMREAFDAGAGDVMRFLALVRDERRRRVEAIDAAAAVYEAWADLEAACGAPLLRFPTEPGDES